MGNAGTKVQAIPATSAVLSAKADGEKRGLESPSGSNSGTVWDEEDICWEESPSSAKLASPQKVPRSPTIRSGLNAAQKIVSKLSGNIIQFSPSEHERDIPPKLTSSRGDGGDIFSNRNANASLEGLTSPVHGVHTAKNSRPRTHEMVQEGMILQEYRVISSRRKPLGLRNGRLNANTNNVIVERGNTGEKDQLEITRQSLYRKQLAVAIHDNVDVSVVHGLEGDPYDEHDVAMRFISRECWEYLRSKLRSERNGQAYNKIDGAVVGTFDISGFSKASHVIDNAVNEAQQDDMARKKDAISLLSTFDSVRVHSISTLTKSSVRDMMKGTKSNISHMNSNVASESGTGSFKDSNRKMKRRISNLMQPGSVLHSRRAAHAGDLLHTYLNDMLTRMISTISKSGLDIIKFAGDALIVMHRKASNEAIGHGVARTLLCACKLLEMSLRNRHSTFKFGVHCAIGTSNILSCHVGGIQDQHGRPRWENFIIGDAIRQCSECLNESKVGQVVVSKLAMLELDKSKKIIEALAVDELPSGSVLILSFQAKSLKKVRLPKIGAVAIAQTDQHKMLDYIKCYIPRPLQLSMDSGARSAVGTTRILTTLFVQMPDIGVWHEETQTPQDYLDLAQERFSTIQMASSYYEATVRQFLVDDKGAVAIIIVGLPPFYHADNSSRGIDIAIAIKTAIPNCKIGISSGAVYSGIVGSAIRSEYSAVGDKVNMAARLMCRADEGSILADANTYEKTRELFSHLPLDPVMLKGKTKPVPIYKVLGKELRKVADPGSTSSLTGRTVELKRAEIGLTGGSAGEPALATIFSGARGVGKTAMLDHFTIMVRNHITKTWGHGRLSQSPSIQTVQPMRKPSMAGSVISSAGENGSVPFVVLYISAEISETEIGPWAVFLETLLTVSESYYSTPRKIANNPTSGPPKSLPSSPKLGPNRAPAYSTMDAGSRKGGRKDSTSSAMLMEHILRLEDKNEDKDDDSAVNGGPRKSLVHRNSASKLRMSAAPAALAKMAMVRNASFMDIERGGANRDQEHEQKVVSGTANSHAGRRGSATESVHNFTENDIISLNADYIQFARRQSVQEANEERTRRLSVSSSLQASEGRRQTIGEAIAQARVIDALCTTTAESVALSSRRFRASLADKNMTKSGSFCIAVDVSTQASKKTDTVISMFRGAKPKFGDLTAFDAAAQAQSSMGDSRTQSRRLGASDQVTTAETAKYNTDAIRAVRQNPLVAELLKKKILDMKRVAAITEILPGFAGKRAVEAAATGDLISQRSADSESRQAETFIEIVIILVQEMAKRCSMAVLFDNAHNFKSDAWEIWRSVVTRIRKQCPNVYFGMALRPAKCLSKVSFEHIRHLSGINLIELSALSRIELSQMLSAHLGTLSISPEVLATVWDMSKGNPTDAVNTMEKLFDHEFVAIDKETSSVFSVVKDLQYVELHTDDSVCAEILRTYDNLSPEEQLFLQVCSINGVDFSLHDIIVPQYKMAHVQILASIVPTDEEIVGEINTLEQVGLLEAEMDEKGKLIQHCYFASVAVRDVVYNAMSIAQKANLHRNCVEFLQVSLYRGGLIEKSTKGNLTRDEMVLLFDKLFVIAEHCKLANQEIQAIDYYEKCAAIAYDLSGYGDAFLMLEKCKFLAETHDQQLENRQHTRDVDTEKNFMTLHHPKWDLLMGKCCIQSYQWEEAREHFTACRAQLVKIRKTVQQDADTKQNSELKLINPALVSRVTSQARKTSQLSNRKERNTSAIEKGGTAAATRKHGAKEGLPLVHGLLMRTPEGTDEGSAKLATNGDISVLGKNKSNISDFLTQMARNAGLLSSSTFTENRSALNTSTALTSVAKLDLLIDHANSMLDSLEELERAVESRINNIKGRTLNPPAARIFMDLDKSILSLQQRAFIIGLKQP